MLLPNKHIRHAPLPRHLLQRVLQRRPVLHLVQLHQVVFILAAEFLIEESLGRPAVGAVGFREHDDGVRVDEGLRFGCGGGHGEGGDGGAGEGVEEPAEEGSYGGGVGGCNAV